MSDERPRGILTESDRDFLRKTEEERAKDYSSSARTQRRQAIRDRIENAFKDFQILAEHLDPEERDQIFDADEYNRAIADTLRFLYASLGSPAKFEEHLQWGISNAERDLGNIDRSDQLRVEFDTTYIPGSDLREIGEYLKNGEYEKIPPNSALGVLEVARLIDALDPDDLIEWDEEMEVASISPEDEE